ncbi:amino acid permease [Desulfofundulus salinus]|uniref:amino acid permease n=1 Tax=Desulfofundulus salinus TaxID=2419843 RepID=UPI0026A6DB3F
MKFSGQKYDKGGIRTVKGRGVNCQKSVLSLVLTFSKIGIPAAAGIINFVVMTAALSSCNSGLFSTGRMLYNLALQKNAPAVFGKLSRHGIPYVGILVSSAFLLVGVVLNYLVPARVFIYITSVATIGALYIWGIILVVQMKFRQSLSPEELTKVTYCTPLWPYASWAALAFLAFVLVLMAFDSGTRVALYVGPVWFALAVASYYFFGLHRRTPERRGAFQPTPAKKMLENRYKDKFSIRTNLQYN